MAALVALLVQFAQCELSDDLEKRKPSEDQDVSRSLQSIRKTPEPSTSGPAQTGECSY
jgi:hypothetical protein